MTLYVANVLILIGSIFMLIAAIGVLRFKDIYLKLHAATKSGTLGSGLILLGVGMQLKSLRSLTEIILLIFFIAITNPIGAHLIGKIQYLRENR